MDELRLNPGLDRRSLIKAGAVAGLGTFLAPNLLLDEAGASETLLNKSKPEATLVRGTFKGANYEHITVQEFNSGNRVGRTVGTPTGKLIPGSPPMAKPYSPANIYKTSPRSLYFAANTTQGGRFRGVQVQDGTLFQDFEDPWINISGRTEHPRAWQALGFTRDGKSKIYTYKEHTGKDLLRDGVQNSFTFTFALVVEGINKDPDIFWKPHVANYNNLFSSRSARTILGADRFGRVSLTVVEGKSSTKTGLNLSESAELATRLGYYNAVVLDGGGSAQLLSDNKFIHKSSDDSGQRALPDWGFIDGVTLVERKTNTYPLTGAIAEAYKKYGGEQTFGPPVTPEISLENNYRGSVYQEFSNKRKIYYSPSTGAHPIYTPGAIGQTYNFSGGSGSIYGLPIGPEISFPEGASQSFKDKTGKVRTIYWSGSNGLVGTVEEGSPIANLWRNKGFIKGQGLPAYDSKLSKEGILYQQFKRADGRSFLYLHDPRNKDTGVIYEQGAIGHAWANAGRERNWGVPIGSEYPSNGEMRQQFSNRYLARWTEKKGVFLNRY